jgi:hypothetical protein
MYIISALGQRGLFSSRTPMEYHAHHIGCAHTTLDITATVAKEYQLVLGKLR